MAIYYYRDGREHKTEFALPVNHRGEYRRHGHATLYTAARLQQLNETKWLSEAHASARRTLAQHTPDEWRELYQCDFTDAIKREQEALYLANAETMAGIEALHSQHEALLNLWEKHTHGMYLIEEDFREAKRAIQEVARRVISSAAADLKRI